MVVSTPDNHGPAPDPAPNSSPPCSNHNSPDASVARTTTDREEHANADIVNEDPLPATSKQSPTPSATSSNGGVPIQYFDAQSTFSTQQAAQAITSAVNTSITTTARPSTPPTTTHNPRFYMARPHTPVQAAATDDDHLCAPDTPRSGSFSDFDDETASNIDMSADWPMYRDPTSPPSSPVAAFSPNFPEHEAPAADLPVPATAAATAAATATTAASTAEHLIPLIASATFPSRSSPMREVLALDTTTATLASVMAALRHVFRDSVLQAEKGKGKGKGKGKVELEGVWLQNLDREHASVRVHEGNLGSAFMMLERAPEKFGLWAKFVAGRA